MVGLTGLRNGDRVVISYQGVTTTGTFIAGYPNMKAAVILDGTEQMVTVPKAWLAREEG